MFFKCYVSFMKGENSSLKACKIGLKEISNILCCSEINCFSCYILQIIDFNKMQLVGLVFLLYVFKLSTGFIFYNNHNQEITSKQTENKRQRSIKIFPTTKNKVKTVTEHKNLRKISTKDINMKQKVIHSQVINAINKHSGKELIIKS